MNILNNFSLGKKLVILTIAVLVPSIVLLQRVVALQAVTIRTTSLEMQGLDYVQGLGRSAGPIADHLGMMSMQLAGDRSQAAAIAQAQSRVDAAFEAITKLEGQIDPELQNGAMWIELVTKWNSLKAEAPQLTAAESSRQHRALLDSIGKFYEKAADRSLLVLDPEQTSYYLMDAAVLKLPYMQMDMFTLRGAALRLAATTQLSYAERADLAGLVAKVRANAGVLQKAIEKLGKMMPEAADSLHRSVDQHATAVSAFVDLIDTRLVRADQPQSIGQTSFMLGTKAYETAGELHELLVPLLREELHQRLSRANSERNWILVGYLALLALLALAVKTMHRHIGEGARDAVQAVAHIAAGEIGRQQRVTRQDEFGQVLTAVNQLDGKLVDVVGSVRSTAGAVGNAARELSQGNDDLSSRTQEQASALEETASSMEEMTATVKQNADNARQANQLAAGAREQAERGGTVVNRAINAMGEINTSSAKIADIIGVIDEIAFQTNLLALNAAVEAARAGEQGRGFAVVATEVRNLAQRSASAAKEIKDLIKDSVEKVKTGSELVDESGKMLSEILASVKKVTDIVAEIAAASEEQSSGIEQVNGAVAQMDGVTQQNAALVEEASATSKLILSKSDLLVGEIAYFKIAGQANFELTSRPALPASRGAHSVGASMHMNRAARSSAPRRPGSTGRLDAMPALRKVSGGDAMWKEF